MVVQFFVCLTRLAGKCNTDFCARDANLLILYDVLISGIVFALSLLNTFNLHRFVCPAAPELSASLISGVKLCSVVHF
ncbi:hypothetical protein SJ271_10955 [Citrobacter freundii]|uniref:hypothetical protein n=1 Tax=Citrobacter freundii TaxID=546 RepID=UPI000314B302|nr:hypothetical protein [Citrobacter freundii]EKT9310026.1 hypothetical protein [Citrobacter freundii]EKW9282436.1 hypothetical protein [Citrobacter freundii]MBE0070933.1 hypothetical protein [Citrobacter freundii]MBE9968394.1 hypothetical protein [Citrobacter freundii]MDE9605381.1 hypothetical protein [Citrobacter freundii]